MLKMHGSLLFNTQIRIVYQKRTSFIAPILTTNSSAMVMNMLCASPTMSAKYASRKTSERLGAGINVLYKQSAL